MPLLRLPYVLSTSQHCSRAPNCFLVQNASIVSLTEFNLQKESILKKLSLSTKDRSLKGYVDEAIKPLLKTINNHPELYTTSSCAGRIQILGVPLMPTGNNISRPNYVFQSHSGVHARTLSDLFNTLAVENSTTTETALTPLPFLTSADDHIVDDTLYIPPTRNFSELRLCCQGPVLHIRTPCVDSGSRLIQHLQHNGLKNAVIRSVSAKGCVVSVTSTTQLTHFLWHCSWGDQTTFIEKESNYFHQLCKLFTERMYSARHAFFDSVLKVFELHYPTTSHS